MAESKLIIDPFIEGLEISPPLLKIILPLGTLASILIQVNFREKLQNSI